MTPKPCLKTRALLSLLLLTIVVVGGSLISVLIWKGKPERLPDSKSLVARSDMTPRGIAAKNGVPERLVRRALRIRSNADLDRSLADLGILPAQAKTRLKKTLALAAEAGAKNWQKIVVKFVVWLLALVLAFVLMRKARLNPRRRKLFYAASALVFGVVLGADPSPMGTVKDAIVLWGHSGVIFPPRMIALGLFLLMVVLANKFICSWGCQVGVLQDLIFRLNRNQRDRRGLWRQYKPPFWLSNSVRVLFFVAFTAVAVLWAVDIVSAVDPFKIYKPAMLGWAGGLFMGGLLVASLFVYRPWCHFLCPFGLVGWVFEKISVFRIKVDYEACIGCEACAKACPSSVMDAILKRDKQTIPDCFACGTCLEACPSGAVVWQAGARKKPPQPWSEFKPEAKQRHRSP